MDLSGRPLLDTKADHALFAGREKELEELVANVKLRRNTLLLGDRGSGKTTLLRQLAFSLRSLDPDAKPAFVEGMLSESAIEFLDLVRYRFGLKPAAMKHEPSAWETAMQHMSGSSKPILSDTLALTRLVSGLREALPDGRRVVLVDELPTDIGQTIFGNLRDELWQLPITWVVSATEDEAGPYFSPPTDAFFEAVVHLKPLTPEAQRRVLDLRAGRKEAKLAGSLDEGNPRRLLGLAREALKEGASPGQVHKARAKRDSEVSVLGRPASMLWAELESLGPVSASDENLLRRLGWTRERAVQVFRKLEEAGLVTSSSVKGESGGRPRKVYRQADLPGEDASDAEVSNA